MKKIRKFDNDAHIFKTSVAEVDIFRASDVMRILGIEKWRLEKFLTGKQYKISPSGRLGKGQGSWRLFSHTDLYRLAVASQMVQDGFTAKFISSVLQEIEDSDLIDIDSSGDVCTTDLGVFRSPEGPVVLPLHAHEKWDPYYVLKLTDLVRAIDKQIQEGKRRK